MDVSEALERYHLEDLYAEAIEAFEVRGRDRVLRIREDICDQIYSGVLIDVLSVEDGVVTGGYFESAAFQPYHPVTREGKGHHDRCQLGFIQSNHIDLNKAPENHSGVKQTLFRIVA